MPKRRNPSFPSSLLPYSASSRHLAHTSPYGVGEVATATAHTRSGSYRSVSQLESFTRFSLVCDALPSHLQLLARPELTNLLVTPNGVTFGILTSILWDEISADQSWVVSHLPSPQRRNRLVRQSSHRHARQLGSN